MAFLSRNNDAGVLGAAHKAVKLGGVVRMQADAAVRCRVAEIVYVVGAVDCIAAAEEESNTAWGSYDMHETGDRCRSGRR